MGTLIGTNTTSGQNDNTITEYKERVEICDIFSLNLLHVLFCICVHVFV